MNGTDVVYQDLCALGSIPEAAVPDAVANQMMAIGIFQGGNSWCKAAIALYATLACSMLRCVS
jgi:hypothetical protein